MQGVKLGLGQSQKSVQTLIESNCLEKGLRVLMNKKLGSSTQKVNCTLGCIKRGVSSSAKEVIASIYSALMRPYLQYRVQAWGPHQHMEDVELLVQVERKVIRMNKGLEHLSYEERLRKLSLFSLGNRDSGEISLWPFSTRKEFISRKERPGWMGPWTA